MGRLYLRESVLLWEDAEYPKQILFVDVYGWFWWSVRDSDCLQEPVVIGYCRIWIFTLN